MVEGFDSGFVRGNHVFQKPSNSGQVRVNGFLYDNLFRIVFLYKNVYLLQKEC